MMVFAYPWFGVLALLVPLAIYYSSKTKSRIRFSSIAILKKAQLTGPRIHPRQILFVLRALVLILFTFALCRPQTGKTFTEVTSEGVDIMLALDTSGSMKALDFKRQGKPVERVEIVKEVVRDFVKMRKGDRMGLIVFGDEAFTQCPLTLDHGILMDFIDKIEIGMAGQGTAVGSAVGVGVTRMKDLKAKSKILILLTDGSSNAGSITPIKAAELAQKYDIKIYTIGVGTNGKAPFLVDSFFGKKYVYQKVDIDEKTLREIAQITGAAYYRAQNKDELKGIYEKIDALEKTEVKIKEYTEYNEVFHWFLLPAILLLLLEILLSQTWLRKLP